MRPQTIGRYHILDETASGGQGSVYKAWDPSSGRVIALKTLLPSAADDVNAVERFRREARLTEELDHPNVVRVLDYCADDDEDTRFIVMEFLPTSLADLIRSLGHLPIGRATSICIQAALGLQAAYERRITHRDVKPSNLLLTPNGNVKVADFGLARASHLATVTDSGAVLGTYSYMSPEQIRGERLDTRSDIYSLGVVLYETLTGAVPFCSETLPNLARRITEDIPDSARSKRSSVPRALDRIVSRCLAKRPEDRFQTPSELAIALSSPPLSNRIALIALYEATDGPGWDDSTNWLSEAPLSDWYGVTTDDGGNVTRIDLHGHGLLGAIPPEIGNLANLELLDLGENSLSGTIPPEIGNLTNLKSLLLQDNHLLGAIPPELGNLTNLEVLGLGGNSLSGAIPPEIGNLTNLEFLCLGYNSLSGAIPPELGNLVNLKELLLSGDSLSGAIPPELGSLVNLIDLSLDGNRLSGAIPPELSNLTNLGWISMSNNNLTGCIPKSLKDVPSNDFDKLGLPFCDS